MKTIHFEPGAMFKAFLQRLDYEGRYRLLKGRNPCRKTRALPPLRTGEITDEEVRDAVMNLEPHFLDLTMTAANVSWSGANITASTVAGVTVAAGQSVYLTSTPNLALAKADTSTHAACVGIALDTSVSSGQLCPYASSGVITVSGATFTVQTTIVVSPNNAGGIAPQADLATGNYLTYLGWVATATTLQISIQITGIAHP